MRMSALLVVLFASVPAAAHIQLREPNQRTSAQKDRPCGLAGSTRGLVVNEFEPGETITVIFDETIEHSGHFRIAFDDDGQDDFLEPTGPDDAYNNGAVLVDNIADDPARLTHGEISVTLPDIECDNCTLQVIQVMSTAQTYGPDDFYYQCADLVLRPETPPPPPGGDTDAPPIGGGDTDDPGTPPPADPDPDPDPDPSAGPDDEEQVDDAAQPILVEGGPDVLTGVCRAAPSDWLALAFLALALTSTSRRPR